MFGKGRYPGNLDHRGQGPDPDWYEESQTRSRQDLTPILSRQRNPNVPLWRAPCFRVAARVTHWRNGETEAPASRLCPLMGGKTRLLIADAVSANCIRCWPIWIASRPTRSARRPLTIHAVISRCRLTKSGESGANGVSSIPRRHSSPLPRAELRRGICPPAVRDKHANRSQRERGVGRVRNRRC